MSRPARVSRRRPAQPEDRGRPDPVGITAVLDPKSCKRWPTRTRTRCCPRSSRPKRSYPAVLADLEKDTQVQVLMVQDLPSWPGSWPRSSPASTSSSVPRSSTRPRTPSGSTTARPCWSRRPEGEVLSEWSVCSRTKQRLRYQRVTLNNRYNGPASRSAKLIEDEFRDLKSEGVVENFPRHDFVGGSPGPSSSASRRASRAIPNTSPSGRPPSTPTPSTTSSRTRRRAERPPVRRRMRQLPHDRLRVQLGLAVGRR